MEKGGGRAWNRFYQLIRKSVIGKNWRFFLKQSAQSMILKTNFI